MTNLTDAELEDLVQRVSARVMANFYQEVGQAVVRKFFQTIGVVAVSLMVYIAGGKLKFWGLP